MKKKTRLKSCLIASLLLFVGLFFVGTFVFGLLSHMSVFSYNSAMNAHSSWFANLVVHTHSLNIYLFGMGALVLFINFFCLAYLVFKRDIKSGIWPLVGLNLFYVVTSLIFDTYGYQVGVLGSYINKLGLYFFDKYLLNIWAYSLLIVSIILFTGLNFVYCFKFAYKSFDTIKPGFKYLAIQLTKLRVPVKKAWAWGYAFIDGSALKDASGKDIEYKYQDITVDDFWAQYFNARSNLSPIVEAVPDHKPDFESVKQEILSQEDFPPYILPPIDIFTAVKDVKEDKKFLEQLKSQALVLEEKLQKFGIIGRVTSIEYGPVVTMFEYQPEADSKLSKIIALEDDLAMALEATSIRIIAPIPGKSVVGFEVANKNQKSVYFANIINSPEYKNFQGHLPLILGDDTIGKKVIVDLAKMPHLLVAGSTGSGKSVALNTMLISLLCKHNPEHLKLILIDPKRLEFASYADIAHLLFPIVTQPKNSVDVLKWLVKTMEDRYNEMAELNVKNIFEYYNKFGQNAKKEMPFIVLVIDELADLMMTTGKDVEMLIARIAQMARAAGIHMIVATQRPSVDVITGLIKVNFPSRISFRVTSKVDSRTILDCMGAEKLLGRGDMLFLDSASSRLIRVHGAYITTNEINAVVDHIKKYSSVEYVELEKFQQGDLDSDEGSDQLFEDIVSYVKKVDLISISLLQRKFRIGYNRSARIIDMLEQHGHILPADGGKMRKVVKQLN